MKAIRTEHIGSTRQETTITLPVMNARGQEDHEEHRIAIRRSEGEYWITVLNKYHEEVLSFDILHISSHPLAAVSAFMESMVACQISGFRTGQEAKMREVRSALGLDTAELALEIERYSGSY